VGQTLGPYKKAWSSRQSAPRQPTHEQSVHVSMPFAVVVSPRQRGQTDPTSGDWTDLLIGDDIG